MCVGLRPPPASSWQDPGLQQPGLSSGSSATTSTRKAADYKRNRIYRATVSFKGLLLQEVHPSQPGTRSCASRDSAGENTRYQHGFHSLVGTTKARDSSLTGSSLPRQQRSRGDYGIREQEGEVGHGMERKPLLRSPPRGHGFSFLNESLHGRAAPLVPDTATARKSPREGRVEDAHAQRSLLLCLLQHPGRETLGTGNLPLQ